MTAIEIFFVTTTMLFTLNILLASLVVFFERRNPASTWAWLLVLFFIPIIGFLTYLVLGRNVKKEKSFALKMAKDDRSFEKYIANNKKFLFENKKFLKTRACEFSETGFPYIDDLCFLNKNVGYWLTENNSVETFITGDEKFEALFNDIKNAKKYVHLEYYIIRNDSLGKKLAEILGDKASEGVEVRILYDGMGCHELPSNFFEKLTNNNGYAKAFLPPMVTRINYRNHRKLCIIDGEIGYIGGFNIGNEYLGIVKRYGHWRDTHFKIKGDAIDNLQFRFMQDWNYASLNEKFDMEELVVKSPNSLYFPLREHIEEGVKMQIVSSGPDTVWQNIRNGYFKIINEAEKNIYIETPYFVPDEGILTALKVAALSGIDVRIIFPANPDHFFVYWASMSYLGELLEAGAKVYQYEKGFIHAKAIFADGVISSVGTANMDVRSFALNLEINAFVYDENLTKQLEQDFLNDLDHCMEITKEWYYKRPVSFRWKEAFSRLISPML